MSSNGESFYIRSVELANIEKGSRDLVSNVLCRDHLRLR